MENGQGNTLDQRQLLTKTVPACPLACLGVSKLPGVAALTQESAEQEQHKLDARREARLSRKQSTQLENSKLFDFIRTLQSELEEPELIRFLNLNSAATDRRAGEGGGPEARPQPPPYSPGHAPEPLSSPQTAKATFQTPHFQGAEHTGEPIYSFLWAAGVRPLADPTLADEIWE